MNEARNALGNETINAVLSRATELAGSNVNINKLETLQTSGEDALATVEQGSNILVIRMRNRLGARDSRNLHSILNFQYVGSCRP